MAQLLRRVYFVDQRMEMREPVFMRLSYKHIPERDPRLLAQPFEIQGQLLPILADDFHPLLIGTQQIVIRSAAREPLGYTHL